MPEFKWEDGEPDPMEGYDTDPEPTPSPPPKQPSAQLAQRAAQAVASIKASAKQSVALEESPSVQKEDYSQAEWRLEKAQFYRSVLNSQLLASDHPAAIEVEEELQRWAHERLNNLLGLGSSPTAPAVPAEPTPSFSEEEVEALKAIAERLLSPAPKKVEAPAPPPKIPLIGQKVVPVVRKPEPVVKPIAAPEEFQPRGRGRPRKHPCKTCGKLQCEHLVKPPKEETVSSPQPSQAGTFDGQPIQTLPDGTRFIDAPNGVRYKLDKRMVKYRDGTMKEEIVPVELSRKMNVPSAKPYPSEQEAMMLATQEAAANLNRVQNASLGVAAGQAGRVALPGATLIAAAMAAPEKEEYIPSPPSRNSGRY